MQQNYIKQGLATLAAALAFTATQAACAYDSAINVGVGPYVFDYQDQTQGAKETTIGWRLGYVGRFNENLGFDVRAGGAEEPNAAKSAITSGSLSSR